ncbi:MAG: tetraacyldisaccharide 4'-kinase [Thermoguttaceae bacterium]|nr:tetraacyldisaccharide 4'-kinase [Thermoguttaceae bacterium]
MIDGRTYYQVISGQQRGLWAGLLRAILAAAEVPYSWIIQARNRAYDRGTFRTFWVGVPVISVGNLVLGGTGKTPLVAWLAQWYRRQNVHVAILSRGYGALGDTGNDEAAELRRLVPDVPHYQQADRVQAAELAISQNGAQLLILDDGFQHRRLHRDLDLVLLDALEPFGFGHVFPRGTLREPLTELRRAHVLVLSRADLVDEFTRREIEQKARQLNPDALWAEVAYCPQHLVNASGEAAPLSAYRRQNVAAFCGVGNPASFRLTLERHGFRVIAFQEFPDHYRYRPDDLDRLGRWADQLDIKAVICTQKDLVKLGKDFLGKRPLWALVSQIEFLSGQEKLEEKLAALKPKTNTVPPPA